MLECNSNADLVRIVIDSLDKLSTLIVAIMGFVTAIVVAKITSSMELKKAINLKRIDAYEAALSHLLLKISAYQNFLNVIHGTIEETTIGSKIAMIYAALLNLEKIESQGGNAYRIVFYTDLPTYDTEPLINALPHFLQSVENIKNKLNNTMSPNEQVIMANELKDAIAIIKPLAQNEFEHILELDKKLKQDIKHDKMLRNE